MTVADIDPTVTASWGPERERERRKEDPVFVREGMVQTKDGSVFPVEITP